MDKINIGRKNNQRFRIIFDLIDEPTLGLGIYKKTRIIRKQKKKDLCINFKIINPIEILRFYLLLLLLIEEKENGEINKRKWPKSSKLLSVSFLLLSFSRVPLSSFSTKFANCHHLFLCVYIIGRYRLNIFFDK